MCIQCTENYYLSKNDKICRSINHCTKISKKKVTQEIVVIYVKNAKRVYLGKNRNDCLLQEGEEDLVGCRKSQGKECIECYDDYYLLKPEGKCYSNELKKGSIFYKWARGCL